MFLFFLPRSWSGLNPNNLVIQYNHQYFLHRLYMLNIWISVLVRKMPGNKTLISPVVDIHL